MLFVAPRPVHTLCSTSAAVYKPSKLVCGYADLIDFGLDWSVATWLPVFLGISAIGPRHTMISPRLVEHWAAQSISTNGVCLLFFLLVRRVEPLSAVYLTVWVVNDATSKLYFQSLGAAVTTDCPALNETCSTKLLH